jgi:hypothetical protein
VSSNQVFNLIRSENLSNNVWHDVSFEWDADGWLHVHGTQDYPYALGVTSTKTPIHLEAGEYFMSAEVEGGGLGTYSYFSVWLTDDSRSIGSAPQGYPRYGNLALSVTEPVDVYVNVNAGAIGETVDYRMRFMLVEGDTPAAWAPAEGETLDGGGALMSANLLDGVTPNHGNCPLADGVLTSVVIDSGWYDVGIWPVSLDAVAENQTLHLGASVRWHGEAAKAGTAYMSVKYADAAGHTNDINVALDGIAAEWRRISAEVVLPSGMRIVDFHTSANRLDAAYDLTAPTLSYGSPVTLASSAHTPYATQDHLAAEYATKAALKVTSDAVTAEVEERGKLAGRVGTLESTSGTHTSKLEQLASSIKSLVKGESTYTDPDGVSATSGIYSLVTQTRDAVTALFGDYTKTADLASTEAVRDAKKAGTDAASAASAAQSTADTAKTNAATAQSTADSAKSTADGLATLIREDATGITVGKSADGETYSTGRTHMDEDSFDVLDKAGNVLSSFGEKVIELGKNSQDAIINMLGGLVTIKATSAGVSDGAWCEISTDEFVSMNGYHASRLAAGYKDESESAPQGVAEVMAQGGEGDGSVLLYAGARGSDGNSLSLYPGGFTMNHPEYLRSAIGIQFKQLYYDYDAGWVVYASDYLVWVYAYGVSTGSGSWDSTTCPYVLPEMYRPSLSHITTPVVTANGGSWTGSLAVHSDGTITVSNRGNAGSTDARYGVLFYPVGV